MRAASASSASASCAIPIVDEFRQHKLPNAERKGVVRQRVKPFIQNVHYFRDEGVRTTSAPYDHVVIFDEGQRAWTRAKTADFMRRRKTIANFDRSEPDFLISYLDRHDAWAVVVCLVGGGQEIHTGEAGIGEWLEAVRSQFRHWRVYVSPNLTDSEYAAQPALERLGSVASVVWDERLHLATSMRSFRSEKVSAFIKAVLDCDTISAQALLRQVTRRYPIAVTRDLARAKAWSKPMPAVQNDMAWSLLPKRNASSRTRSTCGLTSIRFSGS